MEEEKMVKKENEVTNMNDEKNKNVIIAVLIVIIIALIGAVVYFAFIKKDDKPVDNKGSNNQVTSNNTNENSNLNNNNQSGNNINDINKVSDADIQVSISLLKNIGLEYGICPDYFQNKKVLVSELDSSRKVGTIIQIIGYKPVDENSAMGKKYIFYVSGSDIKNQYEKTFSDSYVSVNEASACQQWYKETDGNYYITEQGCGLEGDLSDKNIISIEKNNDELDIIFDYSNYYHKDEDNNNKQYKFSFILKNNNYVLNSVEPAK